MAKRDQNMTEGSIFRHLLNFALPLAIGLLFQQLYNTVDTLVVGQFVGKQAQAAVGSTTSIINTIVGFCTGLSTGSTVVIAQRYGAGDENGLSRAVHTSILLTVILSAVSTLLGLLIVDPMLRFMQTPEDVMPQAHTYLSIYFSGVSGVLFYNMGGAILRAVGDSRRPLLFLIFSALVNTVLDLFFVLGLKMQVEGVAYATIISQFLSALLILFVLLREKGAYGLRLGQLRLDPVSLQHIVRIGLPSAIQSAVTSFSNTFVQSYVNAFGSACMAGNSIYNKIDAFSIVPLQAISMASTTYVGQNWGAGKRDRTRQGVRVAMLMAFVSTLVLGASVFLLAGQLARFFTPDPEVAAYAVRFIHIVTPFYLLLTVFNIMVGALRGIGDSAAPTLIMLSSFVVFRQIYLAVTKLMGFGFLAVALAYPMGWLLCCLLVTLRYMKCPIVRPRTPSQGSR